MSISDPIADALTIIRNGTRAGKEKVDVRGSRVIKDVLDILKKHRYIKNYKPMGEEVHNRVRVYLEYAEGKKSAIRRIERVSRPSLRIYSTHDELPRVIGGLGIAILTTTKGIMTDQDCRRQRIGGEIICKVW